MKAFRLENKPRTGIEIHMDKHELDVMMKALGVLKLHCHRVACRYSYIPDKTAWLDLEQKLKVATKLHKPMILSFREICTFEEVCSKALDISVYYDDVEFKEKDELRNIRRSLLIIPLKFK